MARIDKDTVKIAYRLHDHGESRVSEYDTEAAGMHLIRRPRR